MPVSRILALASIINGLLITAAWAGEAAPPARNCDDRLKSAFASDPQTTVVLVKPYHKGDALVLSGDKGAQAPKAANELCLVKLIVGPRNPGPADAPSTTKGIGIEIWLPSAERWNGRIHAQGGGGFQGGASGSPDNVGNPVAAMVADGEGAVASTSDAGHASVPKNYGIPDSGGDFLMNPDGSPNAKLWQDFAVRAIREQAVKTKAVTLAYYGRPARYAYWDGSSTGGRQGHKLAQAHPEDYDGIIANLPAMHWTRTLTAMVYPHLVFQRDLGGKPLTIAQQDLVSNAAIAACDLVGGQHMGYIMDNAKCRYDATLDRSVLCTSAGGQNATPACVDRKQALALNKIWYGITTDGTAPPPPRDNGWRLSPGGKHLWYGATRGTSLWNAYFGKLLGRATGIASPEQPPFLGTDQLALEMQDPTLASPAFRNARSNGQDRWKTLSYAQLAAAFQRGLDLNAETFARINTDDPDLSKLEASGHKLLFWHGTNDEVLPVQGSMDYYDSVVRKMGSLARVQKFYRFYVVPGAGHQSPNGTSNPDASPPIFTRTQLYDLLVNWVEKGVSPERVDLETPPGSAVKRSQPVCPYPQKAQYVGGDPNVAASYRCAK